MPIPIAAQVPIPTSPYGSVLIVVDTFYSVMGRAGDHRQGYRARSFTTRQGEWNARVQARLLGRLDLKGVRSLWQSCMLASRLFHIGRLTTTLG